MRHDVTSVNSGISVFLSMGAKAEKASHSELDFKSSLRSETEKLSRPRAEPSRKTTDQGVNAKHNEPRQEATDSREVDQTRDVQRAEVNQVARNNAEESSSAIEPRTASELADSSEDSSAVDLEGPATHTVVTVLKPTAENSETAPLFVLSHQGNLLTPESDVTTGRLALVEEQSEFKPALMIASRPGTPVNLPLTPAGGQAIAAELPVQPILIGKQPQVPGPVASMTDGDLTMDYSVDEFVGRIGNTKPAEGESVLKSGDNGSQQATLNPTSMLQGLVNGEKLLQERFSALGQERDSTLNPANLKTGASATASVVLGATGSSPSQSAAQAAKASLTVPFHQPNWGQGVGEKVVWMVSQKLRFAEIQLDPPELGPLQVKVSVNNDQVSVSFTSQHAPVRDALDGQAIRLREILESQGLNLVDVDVSDQQQADQQAHGGFAESTGLPDGDAEEDTDSPVTLVTQISSSLVDQFV